MIRSAFAHTVVLVLTLAALTACSRPPAESNKKESKGPAPHLVQTAPVVIEKAPITLERTGNLRARREVKVLTREEGKIVEIPYFEGDRVPQGGLLFRLDDAILQAELKKAIAQREQAALDLTRLRRLQGSKLVAEEELARARTAVDIAKAEEELLRTRVEHTRERAPFSALVSARKVETGDIAPRFTHVLTLLDPTSLITEVTVSELVLPGVAVGDPVQVRIDALSDRRFDGRIVRIHPQVDAVTRQGVVEIALEPPPPGARPGQLCRVTLTTQPAARRTIPFAALRRDTVGEYVYRLDPQQRRVQRMPVVSGLYLGERVEVVDGLSEGDQVVVRGFLGLNENTVVEEATRSPAQAHADR